MGTASTFLHQRNHYQKMVVVYMEKGRKLKLNNPVKKKYWDTYFLCDFGKIARIKLNIPIKFCI